MPALQVTGAASATKDQAADAAAATQGKAKQAADTTYDATIGSASRAAGKTQQAASDAYHATRGKAGDAYDAAKDTAYAAAGKAHSTASKAYDATKDAAQGAADSARGAAAGAYDATAGAASDSYDSLASTLESYIEWARGKTVTTQEEAKRIAQVGLTMPWSGFQNSICCSATAVVCDHHSSPELVWFALRYALLIILCVAARPRHVIISLSCHGLLPRGTLSQLAYCGPLINPASLSCRLAGAHRNRPLLLRRT